MARYVIHKILFISFIFVLSCNRFSPPIEEIKHNLLIVYPNSGNKIYFIDTEFNEVKYSKTILKEDSLSFSSMCISTDYDNIYFIGHLRTVGNEFPGYAIKYCISKDSVTNIIPLGLNQLGAPRVCPVVIKQNNELLYLYSSNHGIYSINFTSEEIIQFTDDRISPIEFYPVPEKNWLIVCKELPYTNYSFAYSELEFYKYNSNFSKIDFILNKNDVDSIGVLDCTYSEKDNELYITYLLSQQKSMGTKEFFSSYDLSTRKLNMNSLELPWSNNPYYLEYSMENNECYIIGESSCLYIIGLDSSNYYIKDTIILDEKTFGPSRIVYSADNNTIYISCYNDNKVLIIDLENRIDIKTINIEKPYKLKLI
jgi:DNA-binding beta-propeller fold protein YncE